MRVRLTLIVTLVFGIALIGLSIVLVNRVERALIDDARQYAIEELTAELTGVPIGTEGEGPVGIDTVGYFDEDGNPMSGAEVDALFSEAFGPLEEGDAIIAGGTMIPGGEGFAFDVVPAELVSGLVDETGIRLPPFDLRAPEASPPADVRPTG
jgi:hypothetical protein